MVRDRDILMNSYTEENKKIEYFEDLVDLIIVNVYLSPDRSKLVVETNHGIYAWMAWGECCASAYFESCERFENLKGQKVWRVQESEWNKTENDETVTETVFYTISGPKGSAQIEFRLDHNGNYGGYPESCLVPKDISKYKKLC